MSYIYVKSDLTFIEDPASQSLVKAFLKAVYSDEYITQCEEEFGFVRIGGELRDQALNAIDALIIDPNAPEWTFETDTEKRVGQADYVISQKRQSYSELEQDGLLDKIASLAAKIEELQAQNDQTVAAVPARKQEIASNAFGTFIDEELDEDSQVKTALILSSISIALWVIAIIGLLVKCVTGGSASNVTKIQQPEDMESGVVN